MIFCFYFLECLKYSFIVFIFSKLISLFTISTIMPRNKYIFFLTPFVIVIFIALSHFTHSYWLQKQSAFKQSFKNINQNRTCSGLFVWLARLHTSVPNVLFTLWLMKFIEGNSRMAAICKSNFVRYFELTVSLILMQ